MAISDVKKSFIASRERGIKKEPARSSSEKSRPQTKTKWQRRKIRRKADQGKIYSRKKYRRVIEEAFPEKRFSKQVSEEEIKEKLRELKMEEYQAETTAKKKEVSQLRIFLQKKTGLKG